MNTKQDKHFFCLKGYFHHSHIKLRVVKDNIIIFGNLCGFVNVFHSRTFSSGCYFVIGQYKL